MLRNDRLRIAARSGVDDRSIRRVYDGRPVRQATRDRVESAARGLGLPLPGESSAHEAALARQSAAMERVAALVREESEALRPLLPDVDPHDLDMIVERRVRLRLWDRSQRFFIRHVPEGYYVF